MDMSSSVTTKHIHHINQFKHSNDIEPFVKRISSYSLPSVLYNATFSESNTITSTVISYVFIEGL